MLIAYIICQLNIFIYIMKSGIYFSYQAITPHAHKTILEDYRTKVPI
jgi:hypothetical protein